MTIDGQAAVARLRQIGVREFRISRVRDFAIIFAVLGLFIVLSFASDAFLGSRNLFNILDQWAPVALMALGLTLVLIAGGFDLSTGAIYAVAGIIAVQMTNATSVEIGLLAGALSGVALGLVNGFLVTVLRMNVFVATIGTSIVFAGVAIVMTEGVVQTTSAEGFDALGYNRFLDVKLSIWLMFTAIAAAAILLNRTAFGRHVRAVGGNAEAARLSGVRVELVRATTFALSGLGAGLAALIVASRSLSANPGNFAGIQYNVWTAVLLGGNSMLGGEGAIWRTVVGVALLALIGNGFTLLGLDPLYQQIATGGILLLAVAIDMQVRRSRRA